MVAFAAIVFLAFAVEATLGFGATIITVALASFLWPIETILVAFVPVNFLLSAWMTARHRRDVDLRLLTTRVVPLMVLGMPAGLWAFEHLDERTLKLGYGLFVVVLSALELVRDHQARRATAAAASPAPAREIPPLVEGVLLTLGGVVHGAFSTGGPMAVYVTGRRLADKARFRATMSALWLVLNPILVVSYALSGKLGAETLGRSAILVAPLALGIVAGEWAHAKVSSAAFRTGVFAMLLAVGVVTVLRA
ncbi:sulfite exporter TauE/SafE family protein [Myxococcota bacterium]|nr:sulfite exporter TauE/SafE family protein [Myxococcota bacterium]